MKNPKPPKFVMYSDDINSRVTYSFFNLVVDPIKVSDTVQRFWKRHGNKLDGYFSGSNFHVEVYSYDMKTIAFLVRDKDLATVATAKATVREGDTYNSTVGAEVAITSLLRKVINKDFRNVSKEDAKIANKAHDQWLNSEKYNCGNPECKACNAAMGKPVAGNITIEEVKKEIYGADIELKNGSVAVFFETYSGGRDIEKELQVIDALKEAISIATYQKRVKFRKISK